ALFAAASAMAARSAAITGQVLPAVVALGSENSTPRTASTLAAAAPSDPPLRRLRANRAGLEQPRVRDIDGMHVVGGDHHTQARPGDLEELLREPVRHADAAV